MIVKRNILIYQNLGKAKNLVQMWKTIDKENTPPPERRGLRAITPPTDNERRIILSEDVHRNIVNIKIRDIFFFFPGRYEYSKDESYRR
jgi:hypothetical protein